MRNVSLKTASAAVKAASTSPMAWLKPTATFVPQSACTSGAPGSAAATMSTTARSGSHSTMMRASASSARAGLSATTMAIVSPTWRTTSRASPYCGAWRSSNFTPAASPGGGEVLGAQLLLAGGEDPVQPGRGGRHEEARDRHAADGPEDGQEHERDGGDDEV